jgi:hypothetical protein
MEGGDATPSAKERADQRHRQTKGTTTNMLTLKPPPTLLLYSLLPIYRLRSETDALESGRPVKARFRLPSSV